MKPLNFKLLSILFFTLLSYQLSAAGNVDEYTKEINRSFPISSNGEVELGNKYGRINIRTWDKNEVKIDVKIVVQARNQDEANEVFEEININFYDTQDLVKAYTEIGSGKRGNWWGWMSGNGKKSREFKIYYEVVMPANIELKTEARYCDVRCSDFNGESYFDIKYGDLVTGTLNNRTKVKVGYGSAEIDKITKEADLSISYSELEIEEAANLELTSRYSDIEIEKGQNADIDTRYSEIDLGDMGQVEIEAGYGDVDIESATSVRANSNYTGYEIGRVEKEVDIDTDYGNVEVGPMAPGFSLVRIRGGYSSIDVRVDRKAGYSLDVSTSYAGVGYPDDINLTTKQKESNSRKIKGSKSGTGNGRIEITSRYGGVDVQEY